MEIKYKLEPTLIFDFDSKYSVIVKENDWIEAKLINGQTIKGMVVSIRESDIEFQPEEGLENQIISFAEIETIVDVEEF